ncbi:MAG: pyridoxal-dependent decarboxylase [Pseudomonadota bacterium]
MTRPADFDDASDSFATDRDESLDPKDWEAFRAEAHRGLDMMVDYLRDVRQRKVWQPAPPEVRAEFKTPLPREGKPLAALLDTFETSMLPYATGNTHPLFMGWVHGGGTPVGMVAEMLAAGLNSNCGGRDHIAIEVEREITLWLAEAFDFPRESSGIFVTGSSMANMIAALVARTDVLGEAVRTHGLRASPQLVGYASSEAHACIERAFEMAGIGSAALRRIPVDSKRQLDVAALRAAIAQDRAAGLQPFLVVGSAGTVNTGAIDDLSALADLCAAEDIWFHIDGAFGALSVLSPDLKPLVKGLERADSVALDFHKWLQVPYDAGFFICRHPDLHRQTFMSTAAYLARAPRGLAAADIWPCDLGPDLSRGFRALKTWFTFQAFGAERLGATLAQTCRVAKHLENLIRRSSIFELSAEVTLNIVCFSVKGDTTGRINRTIVMDLHESGLAAPSTTKLGGRPVIRAAIVNHRTQMRDMDAFVAAAEACAVRVLAEQTAPVAP